MKTKKDMPKFPSGKDDPPDEELSKFEIIRLQELTLLFEHNFTRKLIEGNIKISKTEPD